MVQEKKKTGVAWPMPCAGYLPMSISVPQHKGSHVHARRYHRYLSPPGLGYIHTHHFQHKNLSLDDPTSLGVHTVTMWFILWWANLEKGPEVWLVIIWAGNSRVSGTWNIIQKESVGPAWQTCKKISLARCVDISLAAVISIGRQLCSSMYHDLKLFLLLFHSRPLP